MIGIYVITNNVNGKRYIGQSVNLRERLQGHKWHLKNQRHNNEHLQSAWNKYGEDAFSFELLEECDEEHLDELERWHINELQTQDRTKGYNIENGGNSHKSVPEETREKIRKALTGRKAPPEVVAKLKGHCTSEETRKKLSLALKGKPKSQAFLNEMGKPHGKQIACVEFEEMGAVFDSILQASRRTGIGSKSINNALCGWSQTAGGLHWRYLEKGEN